MTWTSFLAQLGQLSNMNMRFPKIQCWSSYKQTNIDIVTWKSANSNSELSSILEAFVRWRKVESIIWFVLHIASSQGKDRKLFMQVCRVIVSVLNFWIIYTFALIKFDTLLPRDPVHEYCFNNKRWRCSQNYSFKKMATASAGRVSVGFSKNAALFTSEHRQLGPVTSNVTIRWYTRS